MQTNIFINNNQSTIKNKKILADLSINMIDPTNLTNNDTIENKKDVSSKLKKLINRKISQKIVTMVIKKLLMFIVTLFIYYCLINYFYLFNFFIGKKARKQAKN